MRLLFLTETMPFPLDSGGRIKTYHTLRVLSRCHDVHCHTFIRDDAQLRFRADVAACCRSLTIYRKPRSRLTEAKCALRSYVAGQPFLVRRHFDRSTLSHLQASCRRRRFDAVYCDHLSMLEYGRRLALPIIVDAHNVEFEIIRRHAAGMGASPSRAIAEVEWRLLRRYEHSMYRRCRLIYGVSDVDARTIRALAGDGVAVEVVPISIGAAALTVQSPLTSKHELLFVGGLHWPPNREAVSFFIERILPLVRERVPAAHLTVVGRNPGSVRAGPWNDCVTFTDHVTSVEPFFQRSRVMVVPLRAGSGMRVKILEALARGVPTVTTSVGCEGIEAVPGRHLLVGDDPETFAAQVVRALTDDVLAARLAANGRALVMAKYDESVVGARILSALKILERVTPPLPRS